MNGENYGAVCATTLEPEMAGRLMVHALKLAAGYDDISVVARGMEQMLNTPVRTGSEPVDAVPGNKGKRATARQCRSA